jgi:hypothetical protein
MNTVCILLSGLVGNLSLLCPNHYIQKSNIAQLAGSLVNFPRKQYTSDIVAFLSSANDSRVHKSYYAGLTFLACVYGGIYVIWCLILIWLKLHGKNSVGCASGHSFQTQADDDVISDNLHTLGTSSNKNGSNDVTHNTTENALDHRSQTSDSELFSTKSSLQFESENNHRVSVSQPDRNNDDDEDSVKTLRSNPSKREKRTRIVFFIVGALTLICSTFIIALLYKPMNATKPQTDEILSTAINITDTIKVSIDTIIKAKDYLVSTATNSSYTAGLICPASPPEKVKKDIGIDVLQALNLLNQTSADAILHISNNISLLANMTSNLDDAINVGESFRVTIYKYIWLAPTIVVILWTLVAIVSFGVFLSSKRKSSRKIQWILSYTVLPLLFLTSTACWVSGCLLSILTAIGYDVCTEATLGKTILTALGTSQFSRNQVVFAAIEQFVLGCVGEEAITFSAVQVELKQAETLLSKYLTTADSIGWKKIEDYCGQGNLIKDFSSSLRENVASLENVQNAVDAIADSLSCSPLHSQYLKLQDLACNQLTDAISWGFLWFIIIGILSMILVSLRASWRYKIDDENEVNENMVVDEHEEYLRYISKYKHEWEEYQGVAPEISVHPVTKHSNRQHGSTTTQDDRYASSPDQVTENESSVRLLESEDYSDGLIENVSEVDTFDPYASDSLSLATSDGSISFLSLQEKDIKTYQMGTLTSLLAPNENCEDYDDIDEVSTPNFDDPFESIMRKQQSSKHKN